MIKPQKTRIYVQSFKSSRITGVWANPTSRDRPGAWASEGAGPNRSPSLLKRQDRLGPAGEALGFRVAMLHFPGQCEALHRRRQLWRRAGSELLPQRQRAGENFARLFITLLFQSQQPEIVFGNGKFDAAVGTVLFEQRDPALDQLIGGGELALLRGDDPLLAQNGRHARVGGPEVLFVEGLRLPIERHRAIRLADGAVRFGGAGVAESRLDAVIAGHPQDDRQRFVGGSHRLGELAVAVEDS